MILKNEHAGEPNKKTTRRGSSAKHSTKSGEMNQNRRRSHSVTPNAPFDEAHEHPFVPGSPPEPPGDHAFDGLLQELRDLGRGAVLPDQQLLAGAEG